MKTIETQVSAFEKACREAGLRLTHQRLEIFRELAEATDHPSAESLYRRLRKKIPTLSLDTVYRTLATFEAHGLISRVETVKSQARFEATHERHHHLVCTRCGKIVDFLWPTIDEASLPQEIEGWGMVVRKSVVVHGACRDCLDQ